MADDRPVEDTTDQLARVTTELADFKSTVLARLSTRPTGDIEPTIRTTPKPGTLLLQGQTPLRTDYAALWQFAQDQGLVIAGLFTVGNGSTTFGLPDFRGRVARGNPVGEAVGLMVGADLVALTTAQMPAHTHTSGASGNHGHSFSTDGSGTHGGHNSGSFGVAAGGGGAVSSNGDTSGGFHSHTGGTTNVSDHTHTAGSAGSGGIFDNRQSSINVNWLVYC